MKLNLMRKSLGILLAVGATISITIVSCARPATQPPAPGGGPQFVINSPQDGAHLAGPVFFSVQPLDAGEVSGVNFSANGTAQLVDFAGEDMFKVFIVASDFPAGDLELTATVTGINGKSSSQTVTVSNDPSPDSTATVGPDGAVLGTQESTTGGTSILTVPPGVGNGASVSFEARTEAQVLADTGVDYGALGVTFLGAQEITSDRPLDGPLGVTSGGFGPMVKPGETVVNYVIAPDGDDDGDGELVVINSATRAPNGDVISDPVPQPLIAPSVSVLDF